MPIIIYQLAADHRRDFVDCIGEQEATVENGDFRLGLGKPGAIQINSAGQQGVLSQKTGFANGAILMPCAPNASRKARAVATEAGLSP